MTYGVSYKYGYKIKNKDIFKILYFSIYKNIFQIARDHKFLLRYHCISNLLYFNVIQLHDKTFFPKGACLLLVFNALLIAIFFFSFFFSSFPFYSCIWQRDKFRTSVWKMFVMSFYRVLMIIQPRTSAYTQAFQRRWSET